MANWRDIGDVPEEVYRSEFARMVSPMHPYARQCWEAARPHSALILAKMFHEQKYATWNSVIPTDYHNPCSLAKPKGTPADGVNRWERYASWADGIRACRERITSPTYKDGVYAKTTTVADLIRVFAPPSENDTNHYIDVVNALLQKWPRIEQETSSMPITYGKVPHPGYLDRPIQKPAGAGQDNLGKRTPKFVVLHRILGSLWGTDAYFRMAGVNALTDYGVGVQAQDGEAQAGVIIRWNDPLGYQSGWASGPVNGAYGDGAAIVNEYGVNAVNRDGVSIEISGFQNTPLDPVAFEEIAKLMAYWWDQMRIPHTSAPINPATGISAVIWHQEFTLGSGKECPFKVVMDATPALIDRATAILEQYQTGGAVTTTAAPEKPAAWPKAIIPAFLGDRTKTPVVDYDGTDLVLVDDRYKALKTTPVYQRASRTAKKLRSDLAPGTEFAVAYVFQANGETWGMSTFGSRIPLRDAERVADAA